MAAVMSPIPELDGEPDEDDRRDPPPRDNLPNLDPQTEQELVGRVRYLFQRARDKRRPVVDRWRNNYRALHNSQWAVARPSHLSKIRLPEILPIVDSIVSWSTDQPPTFDASPAVPPMNPWYPDLDQMAQDLVTTIRATWHVDQFDPEVEKVVWDGYTYGIGIFKTTWDGSAFDGYGNAVLRRVDPFTFYWDPNASSFKDGDYGFEVSTISRQQLERRFPGALARIGDGWLELGDQQPTQLDSLSTGGARPNPGLLPATSNSAPPSSSMGVKGQSGTRNDVDNDNGVTLIEAWLRTPCTDPDDDTRKPYDGWRCVVICGNRVLMDAMATELWGHGNHPYDRYVPMETGEFYGDSMVELLAPLQASINQIVASIEQNIRLMGNPVLVDSSRAGISRTKITNRPGERLTTVGDPNQVRWMDPPKMSPQEATDLVRFLIGEMDRISGLSAIVRGATPTGRNAQGVIDSVQEAAFVRIRKAKRNLALALGSAGEKVASLIVDFYTTPRLVSTIGPSGERTSLALRANHFYDPSTAGTAPMRYQLLVDTGENASQSRGQRIAEADALFAMNALDREAVLEIHGIPGWQAIVSRMREQDAQGIQQGPTQHAGARR